MKTWLNEFEIKKIYFFIIIYSKTTVYLVKFGGKGLDFFFENYNDYFCVQEFTLFSSICYYCYNLKIKYLNKLNYVFVFKYVIYVPHFYR